MPEVKVDPGAQSFGSQVQDRGLVWFARFVVLSVFTLMCAGALVVGHKASLTDPTWPAFTGRALPSIATYRGGLAYEDSHRLIAGTTAVLIVVLAIWLQRREPRRWVRMLGGLAVAGVASQAIMGGLVVLLKLERGTPLVHALLAQIVFSLVLTIAIVLSRWWQTPGEPIMRPGNSSFRLLSKLVVGLVLVQILLGAGVRHAGPRFDSNPGPEVLIGANARGLNQAFQGFLDVHVFFALALTAAASFLAARVFYEYRDVTMFRRTVVIGLCLIGIQAIWGAEAVLPNRTRLISSVPSLHDIYISSAHVPGGALILGTLLILALRAHQRLVPARAETVRQDTAGPAA